jgi:hypothetical protein
MLLDNATEILAELIKDIPIRDLAIHTMQERFRIYIVYETPARMLF